MVVRDKDVLAELSRIEGTTRGGERAVQRRGPWPRSSSPGAAPPRQRLRAVRELLDAGVNAGVLMSPIVPGISSKPALIERTIADAAHAGVPVVGSNVMHLQGGTRDHFMAWLAQEYPQLVEGYQRLYARDYAPAAYCAEVRNGGRGGPYKARAGLPRYPDSPSAAVLARPDRRSRQLWWRG